jgi:predicted O-methyltransferase YrrM
MTMTRLFKALRERLSQSSKAGVSMSAQAESPPYSANTVFDATAVREFFDPVILNPGTLGALAASPETLRHGLELMERLEPDSYTQYLSAYYRTGLERFGEHWRYADIITVLVAVAQCVRPQSYLEIGVRRGRSLAVVSSICPRSKIVGFDMWVPDYAGMPNPGPDFVRSELDKIGHLGDLTLITGDSHKTVPKYFEDHPEMYFDAITVDGDHSEVGAGHDLLTVIPRLKVGGVIVFDDISSPVHPYLRDVWRRIMEADDRFLTWNYTELGYGVGLAIRKRA